MTHWRGFDAARVAYRIAAHAAQEWAKGGPKRKETDSSRRRNRLQLPISGQLAAHICIVVPGRLRSFEGAARREAAKLGDFRITPIPAGGKLQDGMRTVPPAVDQIAQTL